MGTEVPAEGWMGWFLGVSEKDVLGAHRDRVFADGSFHGPAGRVWPAGTFSWPQVNELKARIKYAETDERRPAARLTVCDGIDIGKLQAELRTEDRAMVQVASNFNCLENPSRSCTPDYGYLVEGYAVDATQGPAASFGVPAASLLRAHYCYHGPDTPVEAWGQTEARQLDLLEDVQHHYGKCVNGKATLTGKEKPLRSEDVEPVSGQIRVGVHEDAEVVFERGSNRQKLRAILGALPKVDQVLSASINWRSPGVRPGPEQLRLLTQAALRASYDGAYLAAIGRKRKLLLLTLVGGGSFANPEELILGELAAAHQRWCAHPASELEEVRLCLFPKGSAKKVAESLAGMLGFKALLGENRR